MSVCPCYHCPKRTERCKSWCPDWPKWVEEEQIKKENIRIGRTKDADFRNNDGWQKYHKKQHHATSSSAYRFAGKG